MGGELQVDRGSRILLLGAMDEEIRALLDCLLLETTETWCGFTFYLGSIDGVPVIISKSGVGKVFAAMVTQHLIDRYRPRAVLFSGVAGAIAADLNPGDIILGERLIYHDFDVQALGFKTGEIPFTNLRYFEGHLELLGTARKVTLDGVRIRLGCIGTGDQFVTRKENLPDLELDCVDMEGAAVAHVCSLNQVPFLVIRIISDRADGSADTDFLENLPRFAHHSIEVLRRVMEDLKS